MYTSQGINSLKKIDYVSKINLFIIDTRHVLSNKYLETINCTKFALFYFSYLQKDYKFNL